MVECDLTKWSNGSQEIGPEEIARLKRQLHAIDDYGAAPFSLCLCLSLSLSLSLPPSLSLSTLPHSLSLLSLSLSLSPSPGRQARRIPLRYY